VTLYLLCGLAFSGKSTLAAAIEARTGAVVVSLDDINAKRGLSGGLGIPDQEWATSHHAALAQAEDMLRRGLAVVIDDTNCFRFLRDDYRAMAGRVGATCVVIYLDAPLPLVRARLSDNDRTHARPRVTEEVLLDLVRKFEAPGPDEPTLRFPSGTDPAQWVAATLLQELRTDRLLLRRWLPSDRTPFAALNADQQVMEHFPAVLSREESDAVAARIELGFERHGFGLWAVEIPDVAPFAGFIGLSVPGFEAHFTPCVEIGWRLAAAHWGRGYATEGARAVLAFGFQSLSLREIVSFTVPGNVRSRRVMERIGMAHDLAGDFDHLALPEGHALRRHVLYRIARPERPDVRL
jgi:RimJ/RimL family protein N-acetyltransferase/predicted kinase